MIAWIHTPLAPVELGVAAPGDSTWRMPEAPAVALAAIGRSTPYTVATEDGVHTFDAHRVNRSAPVLGAATLGTLDLFFHSADFVADCVHKALDAWQDRAPWMRRPSVEAIQTTWTVAVLRNGLVVGQGTPFPNTATARVHAARLGDWFTEAPRPMPTPGWRSAEAAFLFTVDGARDSHHRRLEMAQARQKDLALLARLWGHADAWTLFQTG